MARKSKSSFIMKGSPMKRNFGIGVSSPMKETTGAYDFTGGDYKDFSNQGNRKASKIPSFRDIVSLEQQQAMADKLDQRRSDEREYSSEIEDAGLKRNLFGKLTGDVFGGKKVRERRDLIKDLKTRTPEELDPTQNPNQVETIDTTEGQENTDTIEPLAIANTQKRTVDGINYYDAANTSSRPEGTGPVTEDPNEGGLNIIPKGKINQYGI